MTRDAKDLNIPVNVFPAARKGNDVVYLNSRRDERAAAMSAEPRANRAHSSAQTSRRIVPPRDSSTPLPVRLHRPATLVRRVMLSASALVSSPPPTVQAARTHRPPYPLNILT